MTAQQLAEKCKDLGVPIHRTTITKIENGRPRFDLGELIVLAQALNTSPVNLVYPGRPYEGFIDVTPVIRQREFDAAQWFSGLRPPFAAGAKASEVARQRAESEKNARPLAIRREIEDLRERKKRKKEEFEEAGGPLTDDQREEISFLDRQIDRWKTLLSNDDA